MPGSPTVASRSRGISKTALLVALAVGLVGLGILVLAFQAPSSGPDSPAGPGLDPGQPTLTGNEDPDSLASVGGASSARIILLDKDDPTRTAWDLQVDGFEPVENTELVVTEMPRGWIYLDEARPAYFRADEATFRTESIGQEPESGEFKGKVEILLFDVPADEADLDNPSVRIEADSLVFDTIRGEISSPSSVRISTPTLRGMVNGLRAVVSEQDRVLQFVESQGGGEVVLLNAGQSRSSSLLDTPAWGSFTRTSYGIQDSAPEAFYDGLLTREVTLEQGTRIIRAERLALAGRLIDGSLAPDAVREIASHPIHRALTAIAIAQAPSEPVQAETDVRLRWSGPMRIDRVEARPEVLQQDELVARFEATADIPVSFSDEEIGVSGSTETLRYGLSTAGVRLTGTARHPLRVVAESTGSLDAQDVEMNLATGVGVIRGAGQLSTLEASSRSIAWTEQADFLVTNAADGQRRLETANFAGDVRLTDARLSVIGDSLRTEFDPSIDGAAALRRALVRGSASADSGRGSLAADRIDVRFTDLGTDQPVPELVIATGQVRGQRGDALVTGAALEASLESSIENGELADPEVRLAVVRGDETTPARFDRDDGVFALGDELRARAIDGVTEVIGQPAMVGSEAGRVTAGAISLREARDEIEVIGPGTFERLTDGLETAEAVWTNSMSYIGDAGRLEIFGDARLSAARDETSTDTLRAESVVAEFEPGTGSDLEGEPSLRRVIARGSGAARAVYEAVRRPTASAEPDRFMLLEGDEIDANNIEATLDVDSAGRLLVADLRAAESQTEDDLTASGAALFTWGGWMSLDRSRSEIEMQRDVSMVRRQPNAGADAVTQIRSERLTAILLDAQPGATLSEQPGDISLEKVLAEGAVWMRRGLRELTADYVEYLAGSQTASAASPNSGWVTLFDGAAGRDLNADGIRWDLRSDRIELVRPQPVAAPN